MRVAGVLHIFQFETKQVYNTFVDVTQDLIDLELFSLTILFPCCRERKFV